MVPKPLLLLHETGYRFRAVLFRMVPKHHASNARRLNGFRAVLFRMVPKQFLGDNALIVEDYPVKPDLVIANPPFAIKKDWSTDKDKANVLAYLNRKDEPAGGEVEELTLF